MKIRLKLALGAALLAAAGLGAGLTATLASASGPYLAQGTRINQCISTSTGKSWFEVHTTALGNCPAGYVQLSTVADPDGYTVPSGTVGTSDIVTVGYPGAQSGTEEDPFNGAATLPLSATSSEGHSVSWTLSSSPAGLVGPGELTINPATGLISGPAGVTGTYSLTATATDTTGASGSTTFSVTIGS